MVVPPSAVPHQLLPLPLQGKLPKLLCHQLLPPHLDVVLAGCWQHPEGHRLPEALGLQELCVSVRHNRQKRVTAGIKTQQEQNVVEHVAASAEVLND